MYLDDVIIYGETEEEFTKNVKLVLQKEMFFVNTILQSNLRNVRLMLVKYSTLDMFLMQKN